MAAERSNSTFALRTSGDACVNSLSMMSLTPIFVYSFEALLRVKDERICVEVVPT
jgi:hypothetical protein